MTVVQMLTVSFPHSVVAFGLLPKASPLIIQLYYWKTISAALKIESGRIKFDLPSSTLNLGLIEWKQEKEVELFTITFLWEQKGVQL